MSADPSIKGSGDGTRPTTDGGVPNIGAGKSFNTGKSAIGEDNVGPAPREGHAGHPSDVESVKKDDSIPYNLRGNPQPDTNVQPGRPPTGI